ncbi:hypothetical protein D9M68_511580 [compost metagenome]
MVFRVLAAEDAGGQQGGVDRTGLADGQGGDRDAGGHLHDGKQGVDAREHGRLHRHAEYRQVGLGGTHARQVGGTAGAGDDHLDAAAFGLFGVLEQEVRSAVGGDHLHFIGDAQLVQHLGGVAEGAPIGLGAHDHAYQCAHRRASSKCAGWRDQKQQATQWRGLSAM